MAKLVLVPASSATLTVLPTGTVMAGVVPPCPAFVACVVPLICRLKRPESVVGLSALATVTVLVRSVFVYVQDTAESEGMVMVCDVPLLLGSTTLLSLVFLHSSVVL